jgi:hypothetical protein
VAVWGPGPERERLGDSKRERESVIRNYGP